MISVSLALSQTPDELCSDTIARLVVYMFTHQLTVALIFVVPTHRGMARLSCPGWLVTHRDGLPAHKWLPILLLIGPDVEQLRSLKSQKVTTKPNHHLKQITYLPII